MDLKELTKLTKFARRNGIKIIKSGDIELEFIERALMPTRTRKSKSDLIETDNTYTDEDILNWSSTSTALIDG